jgi:hypothetical protein
MRVQLLLLLLHVWPAAPHSSCCISSKPPSKDGGTGYSFQLRGQQVGCQPVDMHPLLLQIRRLALRAPTRRRWSNLHDAAMLFKVVDGLL